MNEKITGTILIASDGSNVALNAEKLAVSLARIQGYDIHGLYIVDEALALAAYSGYQHELTFKLDRAIDDDPVALLEAQGALVLEQLEVMCRKADVPYESEMLLGNVTDLILDRAQNAVILAMGRRGNKHADKPGHLGGHFWQVAHKATIPIIAGGDRSPERVQRLLFVFTGDEHSLKALHGVTILQRDLSAEVIVALAGDGAEKQAQDWQNQVLARIPEEDRVHYQFIQRPEKLPDAIVSIAEEKKVDLIIMNERHRHPAFLNDLLGSPLDKVLQETQLPVLII